MPASRWKTAAYMGSGLLPAHLPHGLQVLLVVLAQDLADGVGVTHGFGGKARIENTISRMIKRAVCALGFNGKRKACGLPCQTS